LPNELHKIALRRLAGIVRDYVMLMKPRIILLLLVTTLAAMLIAAREVSPPQPLWYLALVTLLGGTLSSGGAGALNQYLDRDIDQLMQRTRRRPVPSGRIAPMHALIFGMVLSVAAVVLLWFAVNPLSALLACAGNLFYVIVYTGWLKRATPQNIVIGGAAGAVPPLVGWAAVTGSLSWAAILLFGIVFCWTPPHFWALSLYSREDYRRAGVPMLPVVVGPERTSRAILFYTCMLVACTLLLYLTHAMGHIYLVAAVLLGGWFVWLAVRLLGNRRLARPMFLYSLAYLALLYAAMVLDRLV
jgi:protoheme IX farnesyltransferase